MYLNLTFYLICICNCMLYLYCMIYCTYYTLNTLYTWYTWCVHVEEGDLGATLSSVTIKISSCATNYLTTLPFLFGIITIMFALKDLFPVLVSSVFILAMFWTRPYQNILLFCYFVQLSMLRIWPLSVNYKKKFFKAYLL